MGMRWCSLGHPKDTIARMIAKREAAALSGHNSQIVLTQRSASLILSWKPVRMFRCIGVVDAVCSITSAVAEPKAELLSMPCLLLLA